MGYELTDGEIKIEVNRLREMGSRHSYAAGRRVAQAQIAKLQSYYRDMAPEKVREKVALLIYEDLGQYPDGGKSLKMAARIIPLVMGSIVEKVKGIENPYDRGIAKEQELGNDLLAGIYESKDTYRVWNEAIQAVLKVIVAKQRRR